MSKEDQLKSDLISLGVNESDIQFCTANMGKGRKYIRIGYWRPLQDEIIKKLNLFEDRYYDDDCGYKYSYEF
jgi:hypothetical protein